MAKNDEKWLANYEALMAYIDEHHHLPDKHKVENRGLLSCLKMIPESQDGFLKGSN